MTTKKALYAICVKQAVITNQIVGTPDKIFPGQLLKISLVLDVQSYIIKFYDQDKKKFGKDLFKCEKNNIKELDDTTWSVISQLKKGDNISVDLEISSNKRMIVNFCIKSTCDNIPSLGAGQYFVLELIDTIDQDSKTHIQCKYYFEEQSAYCIRGDKLLESLIIPQTAAITPFSRIQNTYNISTPTNLSKNYSLPHIPPSSGNQIGFRNNNALDPQLHSLQNGLNDLRVLTEIEPNGMNKFSLTKDQLNIIDQNLQARNERIRENIGGSATHKRNVTPPSDVYYQEHNGGLRFTSTLSNVPEAILRKSQLNTENSSVNRNLKPFQLPAVNSEDIKYQNHLVVSQPPSNNASQRAEDSFVGASYKFEIPIDNRGEQIGHEKAKTIISKHISSDSEKNERFTKQLKSRKSRRKNQQNQNNDKINCYNCRTLVNNIIELNCQHLFCPRCLVTSFSNSLQDAHCPFKKGKYKCNFKLEVDDVRGILNSIGNSLPFTLNTELMSKPKPNIIQTRSSINKVEEAVFEYNDDDSNEVLYYCKQDKCDGVWFVDKTEGRNTYLCPICEKYNCFKCQVIHDDITCEEYNQLNPARLNNNSELPSGIEKVGHGNEHAWKCVFCYTENLMGNAVCVSCSRTNYTKPSNEMEYNRLLELEENENFIPNFEEFECIICTEMIEPNNGVQLRGCLHNICRTCIERYIGSQNAADIKCPFDGCTNILEDREIKTLVSPQMYKRFSEISLLVGKTQIKNGYECCVPNCEGYWVPIENIFTYNCPACRTENCISCKASHPEIDCKRYQQNLFNSESGNETRRKLEQMLETGEAEHCPNCNIIIVKTGGCHEMTCRNCLKKFVWTKEPNKK